VARFLLAFWAVVIGLCLTMAAQTSLGTMQDRAPDFSCLTFPSDLSQANLIERYGTGNVRSAPVFGSDDGPQDGTVVFPDSDNMKLEIVWFDPQARTRPSGSELGKKVVGGERRTASP
jgi:hypothetical protein